MGNYLFCGAEDEDERFVQTKNQVVMYDECGAAVDQLQAERRIRCALGAKRRARVLGTRRDSISTPLQKQSPLPDDAAQIMIRRSLLKNMFFSQCSDVDLESLLSFMVERSVEAGATLITQGDTGHEFFVVDEGSFDFIVDARVVGKAEAGASFGELALLYHSPRAATVYCTAHSRVWVLSRQAYRSVVVNSAHETRAATLRALRSVNLLSGVDDEQLSVLADATTLVHFSANDTIIRKGDVGDVFFFLMKGRVKCTNAGRMEARSSDLLLEEGSYFGERALLTDEARAANVIAVSDCECMALDRESFTQLLGPLRELLDRNLGRRVLRGMAVLSKLSERELDLLYSTLEVCHFEEGEAIVNEGEEGDGFYIVKRGSAKISKRVSASDTVLKVATLEVGDFFGENALSAHATRNATVRAVSGPCECWKLLRGSFEVHLGKLEGVLNREAKSRAEVTAEYLRGARCKQISMTELLIGNTIGSGTFGHVSNVKWANPCDPGAQPEHFALKVMKKEHISRMVFNVHNEIEVHFEAKGHPFVLNILNSFEDEKNFYILLELMPGGELFSLIHVSFGGRLTSAQSSFYAACVLEVLEHLHMKTIIYRDLKPENILIDALGYPKVIDFGLAKKLGKVGKTYTLCGTPEYLAPEQVLRKGHGKGVDYWALGVLCFEMLCGFSPFSDLRNRDELVTFRRIVKGQLNFPRGFDTHARTLISGLLTRDESKRLGVLAGGAPQVKGQAFFRRNIKFEQLRSKSHNAPWIPSSAETNELNVSW